MFMVQWTSHLIYIRRAFYPIHFVAILFSCVKSLLTAGFIWMTEQALMCHPVLYSDWRYFNLSVYEACRGHWPSFCLTTHCIRITSMVCHNGLISH